MEVGYNTYGSQLQYNGKTYIGQLDSLPILSQVCQVFLLLQLLLTVQMRTQLVARTILYISLLIFASVFSDFYNFILMLGSMSVVWVVYIVPCVLYWKITSTKFIEKMCLSLCVIYGVGTILLMAYLSLAYAQDCAQGHFRNLFLVQSNITYCE